MDHISRILVHISQIMAFAPLVVVVINYKYISRELKPFFYYLIVSLLSEATLFIFDQLTKDASLVLYTYTLLEFILLSLFYARFFRSFFNPIFFYAMIFGFVLFLLLSAGLHNVQRADYYGTNISCFVFTFYCLFLYYYVLKNLVLENLLDAPIFWINTGVLFYFAGNLTIFIFSDYLIIHLTGWIRLLWDCIHTFFNVSMNILFSIGLWKTRVK